MTSKQIQPIGSFTSSVRVPGSKSLTNRALVLAALASGRSVLTGVLFSDDSRVMLEALSSLGFKVEIDEANTTVAVTGGGGGIPSKQGDIFLGNSGTSARFMTAACALGHGSYRIHGIARMHERPIGPLVDALRTLGAGIRYEAKEGFPPIVIDAKGLRPIDSETPTSIAGEISSQFISALLQVGPCVHEGLNVVFHGPVVSKPYIEMTLDLMRRFGAEASIDERFRRVTILPTGYRAINLDIEPDASNASYFAAAAAVVPGSRIMLEGIGASSVQGDARFAADCLRLMGAGVDVHPHSITVRSPADGRLRGIDIDLNAMPDMAQTLAVVALFAEGKTVIRNVGNLRVKETDRLHALQVELSKLGASVAIEGDDLHITPPSGNRLRPAAIDTYDDHRMAMSFAVAGLRSEGVVINDPKCVDKTFPTYFEYLDRLAEAAWQA